MGIYSLNNPCHMLFVSYFPGVYNMFSPDKIGFLNVHDNGITVTFNYRNNEITCKFAT